jgi:predicted kinase
VPFTFVECRTPETLVRERLRQRAEGASVSDGRLEILDDFMRSYEAVRELPSSEHIALDTSGSLDKSLAALERAGFAPIA